MTHDSTTQPNKPRIALLHYSYPPTMGGVEFILQQHARLFAQDGYPVKIITGTGEEHTERIDVCVIPDLHSNHESVRILEPELQSGQATERFKRLRDGLQQALEHALEGVDLCIMHNVLSMHFNLALTAALHAVMDRMADRCTFYAWCHDATPLLPQYTIPEPANYPWTLLSTKHPSCDYVVISDMRRKQFSELLHMPEDTLRVIPNGVDLQSFLGIGDVVWTLAQQLCLFEDDIVAFFPSRMIRRKNYELAFRIIHALRQQGVRARLLLTGPPDPHNPAASEYLSELEELIAELQLGSSVVFLHHEIVERGLGEKVGYRDLQDLYSLADVLLLTSTQEGFGIPLLEAAAKRLPIACSDIEPLPEVVQDLAFRFDVQDDPAQIAHQLFDYLRSQTTFRMFKRLVREFTWTAIYERHLKSLELDNRHVVGSGEATG